MRLFFPAENLEGRGLCLQVSLQMYKILEIKKKAENYEIIFPC